MANRMNLNTKNQKRTPFDRAQDMTVVANMYLHGSTHREIAEHISAIRDYSISTSQIAYDLRKIHKQWQEEYLHDYDKAKARELARIDELERAYWQAWENSLKEKVTQEVEEVDDKMATKQGVKPSYSRIKKKGKKEQRDGNKHFLEGIQWCIEQRCKILGLHAPTASEVNVNWREEAKAAGVDPDQLVNDLAKQFIAAAQGAGAAGYDESE